VNRRLTALSLSIVAALGLAACGGGDSTSRTRNNMLVSNEAPSVQVGCYTSEAEREAARAATLEYWTNKIAGLEAELKLVEDAEILPVLAVAAPPRDEYSTQEAYDAEVARLQASFEQDKEREQTEIKSKADRIADLNSSIDAAKSARDAEVKTIDDASLCVGDPGTGAGTNKNPSTRMPCASSAAADLVMSSDPYKLTIRICDEASKLSVQNYDVSYNTLSAGEVMLEPGTARTYVVDVAVSETSSRNYKVVACSSNGYIDTALIVVDGQNVTTTYQDDSGEAIVVDFCGGQAPSGGGSGDSAAPADGDVSASGDQSNELPVDENGNLTPDALAALASACDGRVTFDVQEIIFKDNNLTANEPLLASVKLDCQITTPQLKRVEFLPKAYKTVTSGDTPDSPRYFANGEDGTSMFGEVRFDVEEGQWNMKAVVRLTFKTGDNLFQLVDFASAEQVLNVGPAYVDPNPCTLNSFALSAPVDNIKLLTTTCDHIRYGLSTVTYDFVISADQAYDLNSFPVPHKIGRDRLIHFVDGNASVMDNTYQIITCDADCESDNLDSTVSLTRTGEGVEFKAQDRCKSVNADYGTYAVAAPFIEVQPDLLARHNISSLSYLSGQNTDGPLNNSRILTGAEWFWVVSSCTVKGAIPKDVSDIFDVRGWLVKLTNPAGAPAPDSVDTSSTKTPIEPSVPVASIVNTGALVVPPGVSSVAVSPTDVAALLDGLKQADAVVAIGFDDAPLITMSYQSPRKLNIPSGAKVLKVMVAPDGGEPTVLEYPVSQPVVIDASTGAVAETGAEADGGLSMWLIVLLIILLIIVALIVVRPLGKRRS
jgi:hypothetical protein